MRLVLVALAAARLVAAADSGLDFLPSDTKVVFGIHVSAIVESAIFKDAGAGTQKLGEDWLKLVAITGFDPLHDIDEILMASPADKENAPALLVVRGRFNLERMGAGAPRYHGVAMVGDSKTGKGVLALLDATTAVAGELPVVRAAIDRRGHGAPMEEQLAVRVQSLRDRFDIWGTGERTEGFVPPTGKRDELASMDRFEFGIRVSKGFELGAELHARSQQDAEKLAASHGDAENDGERARAGGSEDRRANQGRLGQDFGDGFGGRPEEAYGGAAQGERAHGRGAREGCARGRSARSGHVGAFSAGAGEPKSNWWHERVRAAGEEVGPRSLTVAALLGAALLTPR